eukprot:TRINITY_DN5845_c0_g1_i3.p1 TRINITY_DN5845_c0_g1~~TRINITY_DN5845_c0_g1_i3.p1  ORF type:complete len:551 (-),score=83.62 TRINITY_DN5845_c0_g1_i3:23-1675(-)
MASHSLLVLALLLQWLQGVVGCTTLAAGREATADGSVLLSHSDDGEAFGDPRLCFIPAADHASGAMRPIYYDTEAYPRFLGTDRGSCYQPHDGQVPYAPIGHIPEVSHTYAYYESTYGALNEHGVGIGESTCSGMFGTNATGHGGKALLSVDSLSRIAMERTNSSRDAVQLMGDLAEKYGFYGVGSFEGTAESLMVGDPKEVFIFHILPDPTGTTAIWAAQRVPHDHVAVVANMFVIRDIDFEDSHNFLYSPTVKSVATERGWWKQGQPLDFTAVYSDGEYAHKFYSGRRIWGAYRKFGVTDLPSEYKDLRYDAVYPSTAKPAFGVKRENFFSTHRDFYEGTQFDMTKGLAAGPFADPNRWSQDKSGVKGNWERSIGLFRTTHTHVVEARNGTQSFLWFAPHAAATSCFIPLSSRGGTVPEAYQIGNPHKLDRQSAYWAHRYVANLARMKYSSAMQDVRELQSKLEEEGSQVAQRLLGISGEQIDTLVALHADRVVKAFWELPDVLMTKYSDGWTEDGSAPGYPDWWLQAVGYPNGPPPQPREPSASIVV